MIFTRFVLNWFAGTDCKSALSGFSLPGFKTGVSVAVHNQMGNNTDVLQGLEGNDKGTFAGFGIGGSQSYSVKSNGLIDPNGVSTTCLNIGPSFGYGQIQSKAVSFKLSDFINFLSNFRL
jgi:hypothetical protein